MAYGHAAEAAALYAVLAMVRSCDSNIYVCYDRSCIIRDYNSVREVDVHVRVQSTQGFSAGAGAFRRATSIVIAFVNKASGLKYTTLCNYNRSLCTTNITIST